MASRILVIGEALIDVVRCADGTVEEIPGGSPANVAITLGRLGRSPHLLTALGTDDRGRQLRDWLAKSDVATAYVDVLRTATATAELNAAGAATYVFDIEWSLADAAIEPAGLIHIGSIAGLLEPGASDMLRILDDQRDTALITYDPNIRPALISDRANARQRVEALVVRADVVKASDEDLHWLYPRRDPHETAHAWQASGPAVVIVTEGADGAFAVADAGEIDVPGHPVDIVDTVGAGDTFMGAFIDGLIAAGLSNGSARPDLRAMTKGSLASILDWAARAAAVTVSRRGANPPSRDELA
ncbi:carbohydrate kinase family protein [Microbacterium murale]|uniref:Fructokinase n=1 Tax=Microbacterium murale TaxID=1081040 RepID=A0ABQ1S2X9_9MICO|nr:carbohydrate kinase [Microbacterium murale]GGD89005.1 fructokinase [Microbacterium murale]